MGTDVVELLIWAQSWENDFPQVSPNRETEASGMKGAKEATHLGRDPAGIPLSTNHVGWLGGGQQGWRGWRGAAHRSHQ